MINCLDKLPFLEGHASEGHSEPFSKGFFDETHKTPLQLRDPKR